jgi:3-deoxy-7-phosphoheptulonate synthase
MLIILSSESSPADLQNIESTLSKRQIDYRLGEQEGIFQITILSDNAPTPAEASSWAGVQQVLPLQKPYKLASREQMKSSSEVTLMRGSVIGGQRITFVASLPLMDQDLSQLELYIAQLKALGIRTLSLGLKRERSSPYTFSGYGGQLFEGLKALSALKEIDLIIPVHNREEARLWEPLASGFLVPAQHMANQTLLEALAELPQAVFLTRDPGANLEEWLLAAERLLYQGKERVVLVEEGEGRRRSEELSHFDLAALLQAQELTHLPVMVHPGYGFLSSERIVKGALSIATAGVSGLIVDILPKDYPEIYGSGHSLDWEQAELLIGQLVEVSRLMRKEFYRKRFLNQQPITETQNLGEVKVAFQGEMGAYSEQAVYSKFSRQKTKLLPKKFFRDVFQAVLDGEVDYGVLPFENTLGGSVHENYDLILEYPDLTFVGETQIRIEHNLIGLPGAEIADIQRVYSHPQGLAQSVEFLENYPDWEHVPYYDTAGSVAHVKKTGNKALAAIASSEAARVYGMKILCSGVETNHQNFTRFFILAPKGETSLGPETKASLVFNTANSPGALSQCLSILSANALNMKKLESRPIPGKPWVYMFYVDVDLPEDRSVFEKAVEELKVATGDFRVLGVYASKVR